MGDFGRDRRSGGGGGRNFGRRDFGGGRGGGFGGGGFGGGDSGRREMFSATCSNCGKECQVPFKPTNGKPVYCSECFEKMGGRNDNRQFSDRPRFDDRSPRTPQAQNGSDLSAINAKLDKILSILEPKVVVPEVKVPEVKTEKIADKVDLKKIKKVVKKISSTKKK